MSKPKKLVIGAREATYNLTGYEAGRLLNVGLPISFKAISIGSEAGQLAIIPLDESSRENAERIVACWNAMDGIDDPAAARVVLDEPQTQYAADLLETLKRLHSYEHGPDGACECDVLKLIAKAEGKK